MHFIIKNQFEFTNFFNIFRNVIKYQSNLSAHMPGCDLKNHSIQCEDKAEFTSGTKYVNINQDDRKVKSRCKSCNFFFILIYI